MRFIITGCNRGIGRGILERVLSNLNSSNQNSTQHTVVALTRKPAELHELQAKYPSALEILECDLANPDSLLSAAEKAASQPVDFLINNAGVYVTKEMGALSSEDFEISFQVNSIAPALLTQALLGSLRRSDAPVVANITSLMGSLEDNQSGGAYAYRMSKAALNMFHRSLTIDFPEIYTLLLHPGWVKTRMGGAEAPVSVEDSAAGLYQLITSRLPENRGRYLDFNGRALPW